MRFYFRVENGMVIRDRHGVDLPDPDAAQDHARTVALNLADLEQGFTGQSKGGQVIVINEDGHEVVRVPLPNNGRFRNEQ